MIRKDQSPSISVIVAVRNGEPYIAEGLQSILEQTLPPTEILLIDGQSEDRTAEIARSFPEVTYLRQPDLGLANARNLGIHAAGGDFIAFLDHDDLWAAEKLALQIQAFRENPEALYAITLLRTRVENSFPQGTVIWPDERILVGSTPSSLLARRQAFQVVGLFDPSYAIGCDADWFIRARDAAVPHILVPEVLMTKRRHTANLSRQGLINRAEMLRILHYSIARRQNQKWEPKTDIL